MTTLPQVLFPLSVLYDAGLDHVGWFLATTRFRNSISNQEVDSSQLSRTRAYFIQRLPGRETMKVIIDTDAGVDDAVALLMALAPETKAEGVEILGITCVGGNTPVDKVVLNVVACCRYINRSDVPVFPGAAQPLLGLTNVLAEFWHGEDGLGNVLSVEERNQDKAFEELHGLVRRKEFGNSAVDFIVSTLSQHESGSVDIITLGPMTNLALALIMEPRIAERVGRVVTMGAAFNARGNISAGAEFNIFRDPEAAKLCFEAPFPRIEVFDWEASCTYGVPLEEWKRMTEAPGKSRFLSRISGLTLANCEKVLGKMVIPDPLAMLVLLKPSSVTKTVEGIILVNCSDGLFRGVTLLEKQHQRVSALTKRTVLHNVIEELDYELYLKYLERTIITQK